MSLFPIDINTADREMILKVPGIGLKSANWIVGLRRRGRMRFEHLKQLGVVISRAQPYIRCDGLPTTQWTETIPPPRSPAEKKHRKLSAAPDRNIPLIFVTDGTYEGLLTALFEAYAEKSPPDAIESAGKDQLRDLRWAWNLYCLSFNLTGPLNLDGSTALPPCMMEILP